MKDYQFTIKPEHKQYVQNVKAYINAGADTVEYALYDTKDGTLFMMEFQEESQVDKFARELKASFPYLFI